MTNPFWATRQGEPYNGTGNGNPHPSSNEDAAGSNRFGEFGTSHIFYSEKVARGLVQVGFGALDINTAPLLWEFAR